MNRIDWALPAADSYFAQLMKPEGWDIDHLEAALPFVKQWRCAVDGGAHVGTWSRYLAARFARVLAFEPAPDTYECLERNTFGLENVARIKAALGAERAAGSIVDDTTRPGNTGARYVQPQRGASIEIVRLDDFGLQDLDLLKLDVEGFEAFALAGAAATLERCRPVVIVEEKQFGGRYGLEPGTALKLLGELGAREAARVKNDRIFVWS